MDFEKEWGEVSKEICAAIHANPEVKKIKANLDKNGFLSLEEKSAFINLSDQIKYEVIYKKYGEEGSESYENFSAAWRKWFQEKGVESQKGKNGKTNVEHIMFGSTPDPVKFLTNFQNC